MDLRGASRRSGTIGKVLEQSWQAVEKILTTSVRVEMKG